MMNSSAGFVRRACDRAVVGAMVLTGCAVFAGCSPESPVESSERSSAKPLPPTNVVKSVPASSPDHAASPTLTTKLTDAGQAAKDSPVTTVSRTAIPVSDSAPMPEKTASAMFGAGCFWGVEATFRKLPGVIATEVGYAGGHQKDPTYKQVCYTDTGHAEVVHIVYDPAKLSYEKLVDIFFKLHDPTQVNRQGPDVGTQYRTVIFYYDDAQKAAAEKKKAALDAGGKFRKPIATQIVKAPEFYRGEDYHQQYFAKNGLENTCHLPISDEDMAAPANP